MSSTDASLQEINREHVAQDRRECRRTARVYLLCSAPCAAGSLLGRAAGQTGIAELCAVVAVWCLSFSLAWFCFSFLHHARWYARLVTRSYGMPGRYHPSSMASVLGMIVFFAALAAALRSGVLR